MSNVRADERSTENATSLRGAPAREGGVSGHVSTSRWIIMFVGAWNILT
jgi:hypothetical protein